MHLDSIVFKGLRKVNFGDVFQFLREKNRCKKEGKGNGFWCALIFFRLFYNNWCYEFNKSKGDAKIIFFMSHENNRVSTQTNFLNIASIVDIKDILISRLEDRKATFKIKAGIKLLCFLFIWLFQMRGCFLSLNYRLQILYGLIQLKAVEDIIRTIDITKYQLLVVFYDAIFMESYLVQIFKGYGIKTATMQHGQFVSQRKSPQNLELSGIEFMASKSDYFLAWNKFTVEEGVKQGLSIDRFIICGIWSLTTSLKKWENPKNRIFGVVLTTKLAENQNIYLIQTANYISKIMNYTYYLKYHPNFKGDEYDEYVDVCCYRGNIQKGIDLGEYSCKVEFSLVCGSSVFIELVYLKHPIIRYSPGGEDDKFRDVRYGAFFRNKKDLIYMLTEKCIDFNDELFDYVCTIEDIYAKYRETFKMLSDG